MADQQRDQRPSPEALLEAARREDSRAGKLRIPFTPPEPKPLPDAGTPENER